MNMQLTGYVILDEIVPSFVLPIFSSIEKLSGEYFIQETDYRNDKILGFSKISFETMNHINASTIFSRRVGDQPFYAAKFSQSEVFVGSIVEFREKIQTSDISQFPDSFMMQIYDLLDDHQNEKLARNQYLAGLIQTGKQSQGRLFLNSSISMAGWERVESSISDKNVKELFLNNIGDIDFYVDANGKITFRNNSKIPEIAEINFKLIVNDLQEEYETSLRLMASSIITSKFDQNELQAVKKEEIEDIITLVKEISRQEERIAFLLLSLIYFPQYEVAFMRYSDRAQTAKVATKIILRNLSEINNGKPEALLLLTIDDILNAWKTGDRMLFIAYLLKWSQSNATYLNEVDRFVKRYENYPIIQRARRPQEHSKKAYEFPSIRKILKTESLTQKLSLLYKAEGAFDRLIYGWT